MSKLQTVRELINQRLTAVYEEIYELLAATVAEHDEELTRSQQQKVRTQKLLQATFNPQVLLHRAETQQVLVQEQPEPPCFKEEQQEIWTSPPHIKEEQEEMCCSDEGQQLQDMEEADITNSPFNLFPVKSEDDEERFQSSQLHRSQTEEENEEKPQVTISEQIKTEADGEDCGGPEEAMNSDPVFTADIQQLLMKTEWSPSLDQEEPELPCFKEELEEIWTSHEGEQLVPVKSEDDEERFQSSQLHQSQTEESRDTEPPAQSSAEQTEAEADDSLQVKLGEFLPRVLDCSAETAVLKDPPKVHVSFAHDLCSRLAAVMASIRNTSTVIVK